MSTQSPRGFMELCRGLPASGSLRPNEESGPDRIVVVGGGIVGASIAYHLARRGAQVVLCEKLRPASGATEKSFAWLNASFEKQPRHYYLLNALGISGWRRLQRELDDELQIQWGGSVEWYAPGDQAEQLRRNLERRQAWGYPAHLADASEFQRLLPNVIPGPLGVATFTENEGTLNPARAVEVILKNAERRGAKILYPCDVTGFEFASGRIRAVQTSRGRFLADVVALAAGVDTPSLAAKLGVRVPLKDSSGVLVHKMVSDQILDRVALAPGANIKQNPDGEIVTGANFGPSSLADRSSDDPGQPLLTGAARFLPRLANATIDRVTICWRPMPLDEYPIVGFAQSCPNLYIAAMHSGVTLSPLIGQLACLEILDKADVDLLQPYRLSRFAGAP